MGNNELSRGFSVISEKLWRREFTKREEFDRECSGNQNRLGGFKRSLSRVKVDIIRGVHSDVIRN